MDKKQLEHYKTQGLVSSSVLADSFVLRNRQLLVAAKRQVMKKLK